MRLPPVLHTDSNNTHNQKRCQLSVQLPMPLTNSYVLPADTNTTSVNTTNWHKCQGATAQAVTRQLLNAEARV